MLFYIIIPFSQPLVISSRISTIMVYPATRNKLTQIYIWVNCNNNNNNNNVHYNSEKSHIITAIIIVFTFRVIESLTSEYFPVLLISTCPLKRRKVARNLTHHVLLNIMVVHTIMHSYSIHYNVLLSSYHSTNL